jgi:hypothetical protein
LALNLAIGGCGVGSGICIWDQPFAIPVIIAGVLALVAGIDMLREVRWEARKP